MTASERGKRGELAAAGFLRQRNFDILRANYRTRMGEIDLIASDGKFLVFAEVKTRTEHSLLEPREAVDRHKQLRLIRAAEEYLVQNAADLQPRFDVLEVICARGEPFRVLEIRHIPNAFTLD